jgi:hypothetical protein
MVVAMIKQIYSNRTGAKTIHAKMVLGFDCLLINMPVTHTIAIIRFTNVMKILKLIVFSEFARETRCENIFLFHSVLITFSFLYDFQSR